MKKLWAAGAVAVVLALGYAGWNFWQADRGDAVPATVAVTRGTVTQTVLASGVIELNALVSVGARVSGQVETVAVGLGQDVAAGDLIAQIDSLNQQNDLLQAKADLAQIEADIVAKQASIRAAELALARNQQLNEKRLSSTEALEVADAALAVARAGLNSLAAQKQRAEVTIAAAQLELDRTRITAPSAGTVVALVTSEGQTVNALQNAPVIVKIARLDTMVVKADISEADVLRVEPGPEPSPSPCWASRTCRSPPWCAMSSPPPPRSRTVTRSRPTRRSTTRACSMSPTPTASCASA